MLIPSVLPPTDEKNVSGRRRRHGHTKESRGRVRRTGACAPTGEERTRRREALHIRHAARQQCAVKPRRDRESHIAKHAIEPEGPRRPRTRRVPREAMTKPPRRRGEVPTKTNGRPMEERERGATRGGRKGPGGGGDEAMPRRAYDCTTTTALTTRPSTAH